MFEASNIDREVMVYRTKLIALLDRFMCRSGPVKEAQSTAQSSFPPPIHPRVRARLLCPVNAITRASALNRARTRYACL